MSRKVAFIVGQLSAACASLACAADARWTTVDVQKSPGTRGSVCLARIAVSGVARGDKAEAGRIAIGGWSDEVSRSCGNQYVDFKAAKDHEVRCRQQGNDSTLMCTVAATLCNQRT